MEEPDELPGLFPAQFPALLITLYVITWGQEQVVTCMITGYYRLPQVTIGYQSLPQVTTGYYRLPQITASYRRLLKVTPGYHRLLTSHSLIPTHTHHSLTSHSLTTNTHHTNTHHTHTPTTHHSKQSPAPHKAHTPPHHSGYPQGRSLPGQEAVSQVSISQAPVWRSLWSTGWAVNVT